MKTNHPSPVLIAKQLEDGDILINTVFADPDHQIEVLLKAGEDFGGHPYEAWQAIAAGEGLVSADWLEV